MRRIIGSLLVVVALVFNQAPSSFAALLYENYAPGFVLDLVPMMLATEFTVGSQPLTVTKLGVWSTGPYTYTDWKVGIWQVTDQLDPEALVKATIPLATDHLVYANDPNAAWLFADVVPTTLLANTSYRIGALPSNSQSYTLAYPLGGTFGSGAGIASVTPGSFLLPWTAEPNFNYPSEWTPNSFLIANAEFLAPPVPEPSSALLLAIGLAGVWFFRRRAESVG